jgi:hypothetical protein
VRTGVGVVRVDQDVSFFTAVGSGWGGEKCGEKAGVVLTRCLRSQKCVYTVV